MSAAPKLTTIPISGVRNTGLAPVEHNMRFKAVMMTPEVAADMLEKIHPSQRRPKHWKIGIMAEDQRTDRWLLTHQPIAFDTDGFLIDGQNRLSAVVRSGCSVPMLICYGVPASTMVAVDCGTNRSVVDSARISGMTIGLNMASVARAMAASVSRAQTPMSTQYILDFIENYREGLDFSFEVMPKTIRGITQAPVRASIARAFYTASKPRLGLFGKYMADGLMDNPKTDNAPILLRNWLTNAFLHGDRKVSIARPKQWMVYCRTQFALSRFLKKENIEKLSEVTEEQFAIPDRS